MVLVKQDPASARGWDLTWEFVEGCGPRAIAAIAFGGLIHGARLLRVRRRTCFDGIKNNDEAAVDCGGRCAARLRVATHPSSATAYACRG